jgi:hypothetical protein
MTTGPNMPKLRLLENLPCKVGQTCHFGAKKLTGNFSDNGQLFVAIFEGQKGFLWPLRTLILGEDKQKTRLGKRQPLAFG